MTQGSPIRHLVFGLSCLGLMLPASILLAGRPWACMDRRKAEQPTLEFISDVELDAGGVLHGVVVDMHGTPIAKAAVEIRQGDRQRARTTTDALGRFAAGKLRGGVYEVLAERQARLVRAWAADTAPPGTRQATLIVVGDSLVRGQLPLEQFCASDTFVVTGLVAAVIAIPIAMNQSRPASP